MSGVCLCALFAALNLIRDPDVNGVPLSDEFRPWGSRQSKLTPFEEPYTWNRCAKLELVSTSVNAQGETNVNTGVEIGGTAQKRGFPVRENTKYRFAFELKGTAPAVLVCQIVWDAKGKQLEQKLTKLGSVHPTADVWTSYRGEFETPKGAARAALLFQYWGRGAHYYAAVCTPGYHVLIDKLSVEEVTFGREIWPARALVVPTDGEAVAEGFRSLVLADEPAHYASEMRVRATDAGLAFKFTLTDPSPKGEMVEILLKRKEGKEDPLHLFLPATNGVVSVTVPWADFGYGAKPPAGTAIRFNAMRERTIGEGKTFDPKTATRIGRGVIYDNSVFGFCGNEFSNVDRFGVLLLGTDAKYGDDASAWWYRSEREKEEARLRKLMSQPLVVAQVPVATDPAIPYLPPELFDPKPKMTLRAAVNERVALPVAVANMTDEPEDYRVTVTSGFHGPTPAYEHVMPRLGFVAADGTTIGSERITVRRGVRFRDSDAPNHGRRYDILAKVDQASAVPVPPKEAGIVWIQIDCHGVKPGRYTAELLVTPLSGGRRLGPVKFSRGPNETKMIAVNDDSKRIPIEFEVLPFALEEPTALALNGYRTAWSEYQIDFLKQYDFAYYTVTPWFFDVTFGDDGTLKKGSLRPFLAHQLKVLNANVKRIGKNPRAMVCYSCFTTFRKYHILQKNRHITVGSEAFWTAWREWIRFVERSMNANGFANDDYLIEVFDEPNLKEHPVEEVARVFREARAAAPTMRLLNTNGEKYYFDTICDDVDAWIFSPFVFGDEACRARSRKLLAKGGLTSLYACSTSMRQDLYRYYRLLPWKAAAFGGEAVSLYQLFEQQPGMDFRTAPAGGVAYDTAEEVVPSIRLENLYEGMTDIRYLRLLQKKAAAKKGDKLADEAAGFAEQALWDVSSRYPHDATKADAVRDRCVRYLLKLD